jgi:hypothetical protein
VKLITHLQLAPWSRKCRPCSLCREDHNRKMRSRKQRTDIDKYSFVNRIIINWNQLPADILASVPCKLNIFRKRVKKVVNNQVNQVGIKCKYLHILCVVCVITVCFVVFYCFGYVLLYIYCTGYVLLYVRVLLYCCLRIIVLCLLVIVFT